MDKEQIKSKVQDLVSEIVHLSDGSFVEFSTYVQDTVRNAIGSERLFLLNFGLSAKDIAFFRKSFENALKWDVKKEGEISDAENLYKIDLGLETEIYLICINFLFRFKRLIKGADLKELGEDLYFAIKEKGFCDSDLDLEDQTVEILDGWVKGVDLNFKLEGDTLVSNDQ